MSFNVDIPLNEENALREVWGDELGSAAFRGLVVESYRVGKISLGQVARLLGLTTTIEAQGWLARHGVTLNYGVEDLEEDRKTLAKLFPDFKP